MGYTGGVHTFDHSVFLMDGSYHRALHCFGVFRTNNDDIRALEDIINHLHMTIISSSTLLILPVLNYCSLEDFIFGVLNVFRSI